MSPFFVIGNPRSGTTLLRLMLTSHPGLLVPPECGFALWLADEFQSQDVSLKLIREHYAEKVFACKKFDTWGISLNELKAFLRASSATTYAELASAVYHCYGHRVSKKPPYRWGDKNNFYLRHIDRIHSTFPNAQFIHIVRDGRDIACSYKEIGQKKLTGRFAPNLPVDMTAIASEWETNIKAIQDSFSRLPGNSKMEVRFSDLVASAERELADICSFLHVPFDEQMLHYYTANRQQQLEPSEFMNWKEKTLSPPRQDRIGRYKNDLSPEEIQSFEKIAGDLLRHYGFQAADE